METRLSAALDRRIDMMQFGVFEAYPHLYSSGDIEYGYEIITNQLPDAQANKILTLKTVVVKRPGYDPTKQENQRSELYNRTADPAKDPIPIFELYFRPDNMSVGLITLQTSAIVRSCHKLISYLFLHWFCFSHGCHAAA